ncbi:MAG: STAS domain-containing protein [Prevotellaceae bacterium]|nr:STAS domain-containing protein [Prevotellaceae bacterium]
MTLTIKNEGDVWTGVIEGRLDTVNAVQFEKDMQPLMDNADKEIVLDCTNLEYISSSGLRQFLALRKTVKAKGGKMFIAHINEELRNIFTITGFFALFDFRS